MLAASASNSPQIGKTTHGLASQAPNAPPVVATTMPRVVYSVAIPST